jgi:hypothetical protein
MMAPVLASLIRVVMLILRHHKRDVYWMVTDLTPGVNLFGKASETTEQRVWFRQQNVFWSGPEGENNRVESQASREAPDHYPRIE